MAAAGPHGATFEAKEASSRLQEEQMLRASELRTRIPRTVVPTDDGKVRTMLEALGEPITLFEEREMERRERLRKHLAELEAAGEAAPDGAPLIGQKQGKETKVGGDVKTLLEQPVAIDVHQLHWEALQQELQAAQQACEEVQHLQAETAADETEVSALQHQETAVQQQAGQAQPETSQVERDLVKFKERLQIYKSKTKLLPVWCFGVADRMGAERPGARVKVALAFYLHMFAFAVSPTILAVLHNWGGFPGVGMGIVGWLLFWANLFTDHGKDDLRHLQSHIPEVAKDLALVQALVQQSPTPEAIELCTGFESLLAELHSRDDRLCKLFNCYPVNWRMRV